MTAYDDITVDQLRLGASLKWTMFPERLGAFVAEMDFGTAPPIVDALHWAVDAGGFGYLTPALVHQLGVACAHWQEERYGWSVPPTSVHPVGHVLEALEIAIISFSAPGIPVVLPTPAYMPFLLVPPRLGREVVQVPMLRDTNGRLVLDVDALDRTFERLGSALLVLTNPHNPAGTVATRDELVALSEVVDRHDVRVFADEIHAPLLYPGNTHVPYATISPTTARHSITATSASKAWNLPGLKCAQVIITNDADAAAWENIGFLASIGASNLGIVATIAAYTNGAGWLEHTLDYLDGNRLELERLLAEHLPEVIYRPPEGTYLAWLDCRALDLPEDTAEFFGREAGVALVDGRACGEAGAGHVRLNFATPRPVLRALAEQMGDAVRRRVT